jgi:hypothetical protein
MTGQMETWLQNLSLEESYFSIYSNGVLGESHQSQTDHRKIKFASRNTNWSVAEPSEIVNRRLVFNSFSGLGGLIPTTVSAISFVLKSQNPDFIIRTNVSSYWNLQNLRHRLEGLNQKNLYAGVLGPAYAGIRRKAFRENYASGAGMILSREVGRQLVSNSQAFDLTVIDDVSIGRTLLTQSIKPTSFPRIDFGSLDQLEQSTRQEMLNNSHFRCKSYSQADGLLVRDDITIMKALHQVFREESKGSQ